MIEKIMSILISLALIQPSALEATPMQQYPVIPDTPGFTVQAKGAVVMEYRSGRVLFAQSAQKQLPMASTTKILTALITLEQPDRDSYFTVDPVAVHVEGSSMGLREGDQVTLNNLAYGMLLPSGNDGANVAAVRIGGSIPGFVEMMNARAAEIGMENSSFASPSGLDTQGHYSTAYDMALLTREALQNPEFREICSSKRAVQEYGNPPYRRWLVNHNKLLKLYDGAIGVKTGFTDNARRCLVSAAERDGVILIVVTLNAADDFNTHIALYNRYFAQLTQTDVSQAVGEIAIPVAGSGEMVQAVATEPLTAALLEGEAEKLTREIIAPQFVYAPISQNEVLGTVRLSCNGETVYESPLVAAGDFAIPQKPGLLAGIWQWLQGLGK